MNTLENSASKNGLQQKAIYDLIIIGVFCFIIFVLSGSYDCVEQLLEISEKYEEYEFDEIITVGIFLVFSLAIFSFRRWQDLRKFKILLVQRNEELRTVIEELHQIRGILPICSGCKSIRDDEGYWHQVESYVQKHSDATFSHGICPVCVEKLYPDLVDEIKMTDKTNGKDNFNQC